jgi:hypothetical protein
LRRLVREKDMKCEKGRELRAQPPSQEYPQPEEATLVHQCREGRRKKKKMTTQVNSTICIRERERRGVAKRDVNHNTLTRRRSMPVITMMDPLTKANSRWFQIARLRGHGLEHPHRWAAAVNHEDPKSGKSESKFMRMMFVTS